jgi:hypothetical protein
MLNSAVDEPFITSIQASYTGSIPNVVEGDLLIGHFETAVEELDGPQFENEQYFMLVNLLIDQTLNATQQVRIDFDFGATGIDSLQRLNRLTGEVDLISLVHDGGSLYHLTYTLAGGTGDLFKYNTGALFIVDNGIPDIAGDYNRNGIVDAADYVVWRKSVGQTVSLHGIGADGDGDGIIGQGDYNFWRARLGNASGAASALASNVPEPATIASVFLLSICLLFRRMSR